MTQKEKLRIVSNTKLKITKIEHNCNPSTERGCTTVQRTRS